MHKSKDGSIQMGLIVWPQPFQWTEQISFERQEQAQNAGPLSKLKNVHFLLLWINYLQMKSESDCNAANIIVLMKYNQTARLV